MALTEKHARISKFTGKTWLAPVTLIGILMVNSSNSSAGSSSLFFLTKNLLHV